MLLVYVVAGTLAGILLGLGRPLAKFHIGAMVVGAFIGICTYGSAGIAIYGVPTHWHGAEWFSTVVIGVVIGAFGGDKFFNEYS
jgi:hypothetical protein